MIDRFPEIMLIIVLGMKKGEILRGPPFSTSLCVSSIIGSPPMPEPILTPMRAALASVTSRPESFSLNPGCDAEMDETVHAARLLRRQVRGDVEVLYFARDPAREKTRVEVGDAADSGLGGEDA